MYICICHVADSLQMIEFPVLVNKGENAKENMRDRVNKRDRSSY